MFEPDNDGNNGYSRNKNSYVPQIAAVLYELRGVIGIVDMAWYGIPRDSMHENKRKIILHRLKRCLSLLSENVNSIETSHIMIEY